MSAAGSGSAVMGRDCRMKNSPPARAHSNTCAVSEVIRYPGPVAASGGRRLVVQDGLATARRRHRLLPRAVVRVDSHDLLVSRPARQHPARRCFDDDVVRGDRSADDSVSPRPHAALITVWSRRPLAGLAVNITPAASALTIRWTTTARAYRVSRPTPSRAR